MSDPNPYALKSLPAAILQFMIWKNEIKYYMPFFSETSNDTFFTIYFIFSFTKNLSQKVVFLSTSISKFCSLLDYEI